jgi:hypothetical protein
VAEFVPPDFDVPLGLETSEFVLEPLGPEHNELDYDAGTSSMEHIAATPGYSDGSWPREMTRDENRADLQRHADDFRTRTGFTYTVLNPAGRDVIGCVYIYPLRDSDNDVCALSWVRESHAHLDTLKGVKIEIHSGCGSVVLVQETAEVLAALDGTSGR